MVKLPPSFYCYSHFIIVGNSCAYSTLVSSNELLDQSLPDEEYLQSFTNERIDSDDSDWGENFDRNVFEDVID